MLSLLGDIGGQLGLFLGASILTVAECFEYIMNRFGKWCRKSKRKQSTNSVNAQLDMGQYMSKLGPRLFIINKENASISER